MPEQHRHRDDDHGAARGGRVLSLCPGALVLAAAGLLDSRRFTQLAC